MGSPVLSRSPSATFAPGPHRRSHPNLQNLHHLSLAPLTPKYPVDPADYDAYFDPATSELHTSASLSHIAALPSPGGILTNSPARSRNSSRVRRKVKSNVHIQLPDKPQMPSNSADDTVIIGHKPADKPPADKPSKSSPHLHKLHPDPSWLVQTGLSLTESSRETKGQSWMSKRDSSTSLANTPVEGYFDVKRPRDGRTPRSGRATPARSRAGSRNVSRNASRSRPHGLQMTSTETGTPGASFATAPEVDDQIREEEEDGDVEPNWADPKTQAEMAAHLQAELGDEWDGDDGDPYGMLDFEGQGDSSDEEGAEEEVRRAMKRWRVGGWFDGAVDALLMVEEGGGLQSTDGGTIRTGNAGPESAGQAGDADESYTNEESLEETDLGLSGRDESSWEWLGRMIKRNVGL